MNNRFRRWRLRRIVKALQVAVEEHGLKPEVASFAGTMEATYAMAASLKPGQLTTMTVSKRELGVFISYMTQLHNSKLSLLTRARIGLVTLLIDDKKLMPHEQDPISFANEQFGKAKSSKDDKRIQLINK